MNPQSTQPPRDGEPQVAADCENEAAAMDARVTKIRERLLLDAALQADNRQSTSHNKATWAQSPWGNWSQFGQQTK